MLEHNMAVPIGQRCPKFENLFKMYLCSSNYGHISSKWYVLLLWQCLFMHFYLPPLNLLTMLKVFHI